MAKSGATGGPGAGSPLIAAIRHALERQRIAALLLLHDRGAHLGEDGLAEIRVGGDYPGNAFADFQRALKKLADRGIAIAVASKNDEDLALRAFDELPSMVLRSGDLGARRIDWKPKWQNIRQIAEELNLGLESVMFVDDNPVEREQVRLNLPAVKILELPDDPAGFSAALADSPFLAAALITNALRVYRTVLTEEDYESVMEMIQERRNEVDPYLPSVLQ